MKGDCLYLPMVDSTFIYLTLAHKLCKVASIRELCSGDRHKNTKLGGEKRTVPLHLNNFIGLFRQSYLKGKFMWLSLSCLLLFLFRTGSADAPCMHPNRSAYTSLRIPGSKCGASGTRDWRNSHSGLPVCRSNNTCRRLCPLFG